MSVQVKPLGWDQIDRLEKGSPLYVINNSDRSRTQQRGEVHFAVRDGDSDLAINIPNTWVPINLVEYTTLDNLRQSSSLRQLLRGGSPVLVAISAEQAKELLDSAQGRAEYARVQQIMSESSATGVGMTNTAINIDTGMTTRPVDPTDPTRPGQQVASTNYATNLAQEYQAGANEQELIERLEAGWSAGRINQPDLLSAMDAMLNKSSPLFFKLAEYASGGDSGNERVVRAHTG